MKIVIDIDENIYHRFVNGFANEGDAYLIEQLFTNGTPLPKGHGRIIDESQVTGTFTWDDGYIECYAPTIIEADKRI